MDDSSLARMFLADNVSWKERELGDDDDLVLAIYCDELFKHLQVDEATKEILAIQHLVLVELVLFSDS